MWRRAPCFKGGIESEVRKRVGGLERSDIMNGSEATYFEVKGGEARVAEPPASRQKAAFWDQRRKSGLERSDI